MSKNIDQIFTANPITTNLSTDLMHFGRSPYGPSDDAAMLFSNFIAQLPGGITANQVQASAFNYAVDTGVADAYVASLSPVPILSDDLFLQILPGNSSTVSVPTLDLNGNGPKEIRLPNGQGLTVGDISSNVAAILQYVSASDNFRLLNTQQTSLLFYDVLNFLVPIFIYTDTGSVNALTVTQSLFPDNTAQSSSIFVNPANTNTGACTLTYNGSSRPITLPDGSALSGGEIVAGQYAELIIDPGFSEFILLNSAISGSGVTPIQVQQNSFNVANDTGSTNAYAGTYSPAVGSIVPGELFTLTSIQNDNNGASTFDPGTGALPIFTSNLAALSGGEIVFGGTYQLLYTGFSYVLVNPHTLATPAKVQTNAFSEASDVGTVNAYVGVYNPAITVTYTFGMILILDDLQNNNTGDSTFDAGAGALQIVTPNFQPLVGREMLSAGSAILSYNGNFNVFVLLNSALTVTPSEIQNQAFLYGTTFTTSPNVYTLSLNPPITTLTDGMLISFLADTENTNTTTTSPRFATLEVDGLGAFPILINALPVVAGSPPSTGTNIAFEGDILPNTQYQAIYSSGTGYVLLNPSSTVVGNDLVSQDWIFGTDTINTNNYVITISATPEIVSTFPLSGTKVSFITSFTNTGASTLTFNGNGPYDIVAQDGSALVGGEILAAYPVECTFANGHFYLINPVTLSNAGLQAFASNYAADTGTSTAYVGVYKPAVTAYVGGMMFILQSGNTNTSVNPTFDAGAGPLTITKNSGSPLVLGDIVASFTYILLYNNGSGNFELINPAI